MKIKIVTACDTNLEFLRDINLPILQNYCNSNNYELIAKNIENYDRPPSWYKLLAIQSEMSDNCEYILWMDTDTLILNTHQKLENFIEDNKYLYMSKDKNGINFGIFLISNNDLMKDFLNKAYSLFSIYNESHPLGGVWEQAAIWHLVANNYLNIQNYIKFIPAYILNAYDPETKPDYIDSHVNSQTFILHLPNTKNDIRKQVMHRYINQYYGL